MAGTKRRLAAILSADVVGYSRLMQDDEAATVETLTKYRDVFGDFVTRHDGRIVDSPGDNILAEFASPVEAVQCAVEVQHELDRRNRQLADHRQMRFRIGINLGDVLTRDDGTIYGNGVNLAARLEAMAEPVGICVSRAAYDQIEGKVDYAFEFIGEQEVKNIARPVSAYRVVAEPRQSPPTAAEAASVLPAKPSIAVLPFDNLSGDPEQEFFADGIAEDLITALSRIRWLVVTARNSTFTYKGKPVDVKQVGREMGVRYVLEGSVRKGGNRVRVTAQLIDAATGNHLWAKRYDRELADIFAIQDELTEAITGELEPELGKVERERAHRKPPESLDAWENYQRALWHMWQFSRDDNAEAQRLFRSAADLDPGFAPAHAGVAYCLYLDHILDYQGASPDRLTEARDAAMKAVGLDDKDAMAHCTLGRIYTASGDLRTAVAQLERAIELNPSFALAHHSLGWALILSGRAEDAVREIEKAKGLSPHDPYLWFSETILAAAQIALGRYDQAEASARRAIQYPTAEFWAHIHLASALGQLGQTEAAGSALARSREMNPAFSCAFFERVWPSAAPGYVRPFFDGLRKAGLDVPDDWAPEAG